MAIIDSKIAEEAQRQAREYAQRNDTAGASQDWQVPPPAYEEASTATSSTSQPLASSTDVAQGSEEQPSRSRQRGGDAESMSSDETLPLLTRRQEMRLRKKLHRRSKLKKVLRFIIMTLCMAAIILLVLKFFGSVGDDNKLPSPVDSDGEPIESPNWSSPIKTDPDFWPDPHTPLYTSMSYFSFDAFKSHFIHEYSQGIINSGQVNIANADPVPDEDWKKYNEGVFHDRIFVRIEARYTEVALRDSIRVNKMRMNQDKEGLGIYGGKPRNSSIRPYVSFHVFVYLPSERQRTENGLATDGSSYISELDLDLDNFRIGIEGMQNGSPRGTGYITFGDVKTRQANGPLTLVQGLRANKSIDIHLQNGPIIDLKGIPQKFSMLARQISINVVNGPIWLAKVIARDEISLKTTNGGINITDIAVAKSIKVKHATGVTEGLFRANKLDVSTTASDADVRIDLTGNLFSGIPELEDEHNRGLVCQQREVNVEIQSGDVIVSYQNQDPLVQLQSTITVKSGTIEVNHDRSFEGTFTASNKVGTVEISDPSSVLRDGLRPDIAPVTQKPGDKILSIVKTRTGITGKSFEGRTWWPIHSWYDKSKYCRSSSVAGTGVGRLAMHF
jgi:hypothetical protein